MQASLYNESILVNNYLAIINKGGTNNGGMSDCHNLVCNDYKVFLMPEIPRVFNIDE